MSVAVARGGVRHHATRASSCLHTLFSTSFYNQPNTVATTTTPSMAITLLEPPSPYLLPVLVFIVLFELALVLGKKQRCKSLALEIKTLTLRKFEIVVAMKSVRVALLVSFIHTYICVFLCMPTLGTFFVDASLPSFSPHQSPFLSRLIFHT